MRKATLNYREVYTPRLEEKRRVGENLHLDGTDLGSHKTCSASRLNCLETIRPESCWNPDRASSNSAAAPTSVPPNLYPQARTIVHASPFGLGNWLCQAADPRRRRVGSAALCRCQSHTQSWIYESEMAKRTTINELPVHPSTLTGDNARRPRHV
jgi:hypothetical protein